MAEQKNSPKTDKPARKAQAGPGNQNLLASIPAMFELTGDNSLFSHRWFLGLLKRKPDQGYNLIISLILFTVFVILSLALLVLMWSIELKLRSDMHMSMLYIAAPVGSVVLSIGTVIFLFARTQMKLLDVNERGILLGRKVTLFEGPQIRLPWQAVDRIRILELNLPLFKKEDRLNIWLKDGARYTLSWQDVITCMDPGKFFSFARTYATDAISGLEMPREDLLDSKNSYTELWLRYLSPTEKRVRRNALDKGSMLAKDRYEIERILGSGGQGTVYLGFDREANGAPVVLKEYVFPLHRGTSVVEKTRQNFAREAEILQKINHEQIVKLRDYFVEDFRGYLVLEYVEGRSLKQLVGEEGPQPEHFVAELGLQCCEILSYLHKLSPPILHRDVTPDNLILDEDGKIKLVDFTVAHTLEPTVTATVVGKHAYIPPEQLKGRPSRQSDIYALGCTMYHLLTGDDPEPISASYPQEQQKSVSRQMNKIVSRATAFHTRDRYQNIDHVRKDLAKITDRN